MNIKCNHDLSSGPVRVIDFIYL